mmetsp:Transcript_39206/g.63827  ORF Transcript_39206/g.63827 Transcript_39206/m.63827 type:complete len:98 (+) Transcript_39206:572-865(+)
MLSDPRSLNPSLMLNATIVASNGANVGPITETAIITKVTISERSMDKPHNGVAKPVDQRNSPKGCKMMCPISEGTVLIEEYDPGESPPPPPPPAAAQ